MIKICFLLGGFTGNGGIGRVTSILANSLLDDDRKIHTLSYFNNKKENLYYLNSNVKQDFLFDQPMSMKKGILKNGVGRLRRYLQENNIDILIACGALYYPISVLACRNIKTKCICWEHSNAQNNKDHAFQLISRFIGAKNADKIITLTNHDKKSYTEKYKVNNVRRIYNPIDHTIFKYRKNYNKKSKKILSVGRLTYQKNFESLIEVAKNVTEKHPDWTFDIYGEGELREELQQKIDENNLTDKIHLKGQVNNLYSLYNEYSMLVMTSRYEGFPMTLLESMANGLPLIAFDVPTGPNEIIIENINGYLIKPFEIKSMCKKINYLIENEEERVRISENCNKQCDKYSLKNTIKDWNEELSIV